MALIEKVDQDLTSAMKSKEEMTISTLRLLKSAIANFQIATQKTASDEDVLGIIQKEIKSRRDSIKLYEEGERQDLADKEKKEIEILNQYLPEQASEEEIRVKVKAMIAKTGASGIQDMGKVMGPLVAEFKGKADGALISQIVKEELLK